MILIGIIYGSLTGNMAELSGAALDSAKEAVTLCITMLGIMSFWMGLMQIASKAGIITAMTKKLRPFLLFLFPRLSGETLAMEYISTNVVANILGLGWACTPAGLKAMEELRRIEDRRRESRGRESRGSKSSQSGDVRTGNSKVGRHRQPQLENDAASNEMCGFLILNISSLQLIPVNILVYRSQYGSVNPSAIIVPAILATTCSTIAGILFLKAADAST
jgi:spore maturation protein A